MAAEMKVTDEIATLAVKAQDEYWAADDNYPAHERDYDHGRMEREAMKAAIHVALATMLEPACYRQHQPNHSSEWMSGVAPPLQFKNPAWSIEQAYTIKDPK